MDYQQTGIQNQKHLTNINFLQSLRQPYIIIPITTVRGPYKTSQWCNKVLHMEFDAFYQCDRSLELQTVSDLHLTSKRMGNKLLTFQKIKHYGIV